MPTRPPAALVMAAVLAATVTGTSPLPAQAARAPFVVPTWAFPMLPASTPVPVRDSMVKHQVPGSSRRYTMSEAGNAFGIVDWFPESHPAAPAPVLNGTPPDARACGYCHLPDGQGRPENATLAGLPAEYIVQQVRAYRDSSRLIANPLTTTSSMHLIATSTSEADVAIAARYFAGLTLRRPNHVREVSVMPKARVAGLLYAYDGDGTEPIAGRLIEVPAEFERHELRDPTVEYTTYVPIGSMARGGRLVMRGPDGVATACATCHGPRLLGVGAVPPIAGRSPSYILRQLINFRTGMRHDSLSIAMAPVVKRLALPDMVALAAYVGSLPPSPPMRAAKR